MKRFLLRWFNFYWICKGGYKMLIQKYGKKKGIYYCIKGTLDVFFYRNILKNLIGLFGLILWLITYPIWWVHDFIS